jgi:hypothetical protein
MRVLRTVNGALLWILACALGLVAVLLCVTIILLPIGLPLLGIARRMFTSSLRLMMPGKLAHPVRAGKKDLTGTAGKSAKRVRRSRPARALRGKGKKLRRRLR